MALSNKLKSRLANKSIGHKIPMLLRAKQILKNGNLTKKEQNIFKTGIIYHQLCINHLGYSIYSFPFTLKSEYKKTKTWATYERIYLLCKNHSFDPKDYLGFQFKHRLAKGIKLTAWVMCSEYSVNEYCKYKQEQKKNKVNPELLLTETEKDTADKMISLRLKERVMKEQNLDEKGFWENVIVGDLIEQLHPSLLKESYWYKKLYNQGYYKSLQIEVPNPNFF